MFHRDQGFSKNADTFLGVPVIRIWYLGVYVWVPLSALYEEVWLPAVNVKKLQIDRLSRVLSFRMQGPREFQ